MLQLLLSPSTLSYVYSAQRPLSCTVWLLGRKRGTEGCTYLRPTRMGVDGPITAFLAAVPGRTTANRCPSPELLGCVWVDPPAFLCNNPNTTPTNIEAPMILKYVARSPSDAAASWLFRRNVIKLAAMLYSELRNMKKMHFQNLIDRLKIL